MAEKLERLAFRVAEAADALGLSRSKTYELIATGEIPSITFGGSKRVPVDGLRALIAKRSTAERSESAA